jgi:hypothetical protein
VLHLGRLGQGAGVETPGAAQDAGADVEEPAAFAVAGGGVVQQRGGLAIHRDAAAGCGHAVDGGQVAVLAVAGIARLQPRHLGDGGTEQVCCLGRAGGGQAQFAGRTHRAEGSGMHLHDR